MHSPPGPPQKKISRPPLDASTHPTPGQVVHAAWGGDGSSGTSGGTSDIFATEIRGGGRYSMQSELENSADGVGHEDIFLESEKKL